MVAIARDHVLYAAWVPRAYAVTFDPGLGTPPVPDSRAVTFGAPYGAIATTSRRLASTRSLLAFSAFRWPTEMACQVM